MLGPIPSPDAGTVLDAVIADKKWKILLLASLVLLAYAPAFKNSFISDDYVILRRAQEFKLHPSRVFSIPPEPFRLTTYVAFMMLKECFGYNAWAFYAFTILLHFVNTLLLWRLLGLLGVAPSIAVMAAVFFAVIQNPQEGIMWLAGMNESLLGTFLLATLVLWISDKFFLSGLTFILALLSKESALILALLIPLVDFWRAKKIAFRRQHAYWMVPTVFFACYYAYLRPENALLKAHLYAFSFRSILVLLNSAHRLFFPWIYILAIALLRVRGSRALLSSHLSLVWVVTALLPYIFLTYQSHIPSRNQYVACMGIAWMLATMIEQLPGGVWKYVFVSTFVVFNVAYLWIAKAPQYAARAAPTDCLLVELRRREPRRILIENFPTNPWIAKETTQLVPGWKQDDLIVNQPKDTCPDCPKFTWDERAGQYTVIDGN